MNLDPNITPYTKSAQNNYDLNIRPESGGKNVHENLHDIGLANDLMDMTPKAQATKAETDMWDYVKSKGFCTAREKHQQSEKATYGLGKIFANYISDKELISKIYKKVLYLNTKTKQTKEPSNLIKK